VPATDASGGQRSLWTHKPRFWPWWRNPHAHECRHGVGSGNNSRTDMDVDHDARPVGVISPDCRRASRLAVASHRRHGSNRSWKPFGQNHLGLFCLYLVFLTHFSSSFVALHFNPLQFWGVFFFFCSLTFQSLWSRFFTCTENRRENWIVSFVQYETAKKIILRYFTKESSTSTSNFSPLLCV